MPTPWFFERLGLPPTKDIKLIKRAYAVALKNIDQQDEREAFETLRTAYEQALAWAARPEEDEDEDEDDPDDEWEDDDTDEDEADSPATPTWRAIDLEDAPSFASPDPDDGAAPPPHAAAPPPAGAAPSPPDVHDVLPPAAPPLNREREELAAQHIAIQDWLARLFEAEDATLDRVLDDAMKDPRLGHLDSQSQFEAHVADALYNDPAGRIALFNVACRRFGWADRNAKFSGNTATANWITRVVNQELQWQEQPATVLGEQNAAIQAALQTAAPTNRKAYKFVPVLDSIHDNFPEWLVLRLPAGRLHQWQEVYAGLSKTWLRLERIRHYYLGDRRKTPGRVLVAVLLMLMFQGSVRTIINSTMSSPSSSAAPHSQVAVPSPATPATDPVLAYEFTGAVTADSCESAHEFIHESNWLEIDDTSAIALLTTRVLLCQELKRWPQANDPMVACLRSERIAALTADRPEDPKHCAVPTSAQK